MSERDGRLLDERELLELASAGAERTSRPFLYLDDQGAVRFAVYSPEESAITTGRVSCAAGR